MTVRELIADLQGFTMDAKIVIAESPDSQAEILSIYDNVSFPNKMPATEVYIDIEFE